MNNVTKEVCTYTLYTKIGTGKHMDVQCSFQTNLILRHPTYQMLNSSVIQAITNVL